MEQAWSEEDQSKTGYHVILFQFPQILSLELLKKWTTMIKTSTQYEFKFIIQLQNFIG